jgi:hypothetical protein
MEQIKIGYDEYTKLYIIPNRNYSIINSNREKPETIYFNNSNVFVTSIKPTSYQTYTTKLITTGYVDNDKKTITVEEYNSQLEELQSKGEYDEYDYIWCFDNIEDEIRYKHFERRWTKIQKQVEDIIDYEIIIINVPVSEYEDIQPLATLEDIDSCEKALFKYIPNPKRYLKEYCESLGLKYDPNGKNGFSWSTHSGIEYAKIDDNYIFLGEKPKFQGLTGSYENCINKMNSHITLIKQAVDDLFLKQDKTVLNEITKGEFFKSILSIQNKVRNINVYTKDSHSKNFLLGDISKLLNKLRKDGTTI